MRQSIEKEQRKERKREHVGLSTKEKGEWRKWRREKMAKETVA